jgi:hypothetical protein
MVSPALDLDRLLKLRLAIGRLGEGDRAAWWNTRGQLGATGGKAVSRGFPRTHHFAQARAVFAVADARSAEVFEPTGCVTLWRLDARTEESFDGRWERWLDHGRLVLHRREGRDDRGDLRRVRGVGLRTFEAREPRPPARGELHRRESATWLRDVAKVLNRRFDPAGRDRRSSCSRSTVARRGVEAAAPLAHDARRVPRPRLPRELALRARTTAARSAFTPEDVEKYLGDIGKRGGTTEHAWSEQTTKRVAAGLLKIAVDFGLLRGSVAKEFASFHLPERSFLYLLHAMRDEKLSPASSSPRGSGACS